MFLAVSRGHKERRKAPERQRQRQRQREERERKKRKKEEMEQPRPQPHPLHGTWAMWEHRRAADGSKADKYLQGCKQLCEFSTVEDFWKYFNYVPLPSAFFSDGTRRFDFVDRSVEGLSLFRSGIEPKWEDPRMRRVENGSLRREFPLRISTHAGRTLFWP